MADGQQYDNNMSGVLFKNTDKQTENHPDYKGTCEVNNQEFWLSAWIKTSKAGAKFMRLSFQPKQPQSGGGQTSVVTPQVPSTPDDEVPF